MASRMTFFITLLLLHQSRNVMQNADMRTTVNLAPETHEFVSYYASARGLTLSAALDELVQKAQTAPPAASPVEICRNERGFPIFPPTGRKLTSERVKKLEEEEFDPRHVA